MIIQIAQRELEFVIIYEIIVAGVTISKLSVHLRRTGARVGLIGSTLDPDTVRPLQPPGTRIHIAGQGNPQIVNMIIHLALPYCFKQVDPRFPQIGHMIHILIATGHMVVGIAGNAVCGRPCRILITVGKSIPFPVIHAVILLPFY